MSHPTPGPGANSYAYHFGPSTEDEMEADLKRIDAMEENRILRGIIAKKITTPTLKKET